MKPFELCEMLSLERNPVLSGKRQKRSYSDSSYDATLPKVPISCRVSSESGYGTTTTTRSSVSSERERLCAQCRHADSDEVFYKEEEETTVE